MTGNVVGTDISHSQLLGNGSAGSGPWHGIQVTAQGPVTIGQAGSGNFVANTVTGHGISLSDAEQIDLFGNTVRGNEGTGSGSAPRPS